MRPLTLTMQAFGPFAGTERIDFAELGAAPLFLINGPTGAGKTTILDAICYALYGTTTGAEREGAEMRCQYSSPDLLTEVCLRFELGGERYQIARLPDQWRPKQRGEGTTLQKARATLYRLGEDGGTESGTLLVEQKVSDATRYVRELTGLNADQFRQVMVLPQGQFRKLLLADSQEREVIFQSLFQTGVYKQIEERLKLAAAGIRRDYEAGNNKLRGILEAGDVADEEALEAELARVTEQVARLDDDYQARYRQWQQAEQQLTRARQVRETRQRLDKVGRELAALAEREPAIAAQREQLHWAREAARLEPLRRQRDHSAAAAQQTRDEEAAARARLLQAQERLEDCARNLATEESRQTERLALERTQAELEGLRPGAVQLQEVRADLEQRTAAFEAARREEESAREAQGRARESGEKLGREIETLRERVAAAQGADLDLHRAREALARGRRLQSLHEALAAGRDRLEEQAQQHLELEREQARQTGALKALRRDWHLGQARLLARDLETGQPCPVCGSEVHPAPASGEARVPDEAALEAQEARCREAGERAAACERDITALRTEQAGLQREIGELAPADAPAPDLPGLEAQVRRLQEQLARRERHQDELATLEARRPAMDAAAHAAEEAVQASVRRLEDIRGGLTAVRARIEQLEAGLPADYREVTVLEAALAQTREQAAALAAAFDRARETHVAADKQLAVSAAALEAAGRRLEGAEREAREVAADYAEALAQSAFESDHALGRAAMPDDGREALQASLDQHERTLTSLRASQRTLQEELEGHREEDVQALEATEREARSARDSALEARQVAAGRAESLGNTRGKLARQREANRALEERYRVVGTLADVASGQGGARISLQRYVLGVLLDDVLAQASQRLLKMSAGRYQLIRKLDPNKGRRAAGLDLEVHDDYTGSARSVATLSGGESFMAALSLALGLSDVVQSQAGGIALDTLFVDEGFGSLDTEALELAINTLLELQRAGRMVGIISHVTELREQMDVRIDLRAGRRGSSLEVVSPYTALPRSLPAG